MKNIRQILTKAGLVLSTGVVTLGVIAVSTHGHANYTASASINMNPAYDLSEWQHTMTDAQAQQLKNEASFVIIRVQYGSNYQDKVYQNNISLLNKYGIPYGVYSYSLYNSVAQAQGEAQTLYNRVPNARFYVNDLEQSNGMSASTLNAATSAWADQMRTLTNKPVILYSGLYFMNNTVGDAKNDYDTLWLASYGSGEPNPSYTYGLWQFTDSYRSTALGQNIDASVIPDGGKPLSFFTGSNATTSTTSSVASSSSAIASSQASSASSTATSSAASSSSAVTSSSATSSASVATSSSSSSSTVSSSSATSSVASSSAKSSTTAKSSSASSYVDNGGIDTSATNSSSSAKKNDVNKKPSKKHKLTIKVMKPKVDTKNYYSSKHVKHLKVTAKNGIYIYNSVNHRVKHVKRGHVITIESFKQQGTKTIAMVADGTHFTANKSYVKALK
ncbi:GH25 family lysozyme [Lactobacillaceae bacterium Melli_B4]